MFDEQKRAGAQRITFAVDGRGAAAGDDVQPLVAAAMAVVRAALAVARLEHHLRGLSVAVAQCDAKPFAKTQVLALHDGPALQFTFSSYFTGLAKRTP